MVLLTVRSGRDGRLLARIVEKDGHSFVLDVGERRVIDDATQRLLKGFTMFRMGGLVTATPQTAELLCLLAEFYASEGGLVAFDEPDWPGRNALLGTGGHGSAAALPREDQPFDDDETDYAPLPPPRPAPLVPRRVLRRLPPMLGPPPDDLENDPPTELAAPIRQPLPVSGPLPDDTTS
jgi:hypothetical protein